MPVKKNTLKAIHARARLILKKHKTMPYKEAFGIATDELKKKAPAKKVARKKVSRSAPKKRVAKKAAPKKKDYHQTGRSTLAYDLKRRALPPGKRVSRSGVTYYERRRNRTDQPGTMAGVSEKALIGEIEKRIKGIIGKAYTDKLTCKTKREKNLYDKIIIENKRKLRKLH